MESNKSLLNKLPKELLIEIFEKQNLSDYIDDIHYCENQIEKWKCRMNKLVTDRMNLIIQNIKKHVPEKFTYLNDQYTYTIYFCVKNNFNIITFELIRISSWINRCNFYFMEKKLKLIEHNYSYIINFIEKFPMFAKLYEYVTSEEFLNLLEN